MARPKVPALVLGLRGAPEDVCVGVTEARAKGRSRALKGLPGAGTKERDGWVV
jgi:hypothetical protein